MGAANTPVFDAEEAKKALIGIARDLKGLAYAFNTKSSYMMLFDWMYPFLLVIIESFFYFYYFFSLLGQLTENHLRAFIYLFIEIHLRGPKKDHKWVTKCFQFFFFLNYVINNSQIIFIGLTLFFFFCF